MERMGQEQTLAALQKNKDIVGIFGTNVFSAQGSYQAVVNAGLTGAVKIASWDATKELIGALKKGQVDLVLAQKPAEMGALTRAALSNKWETARTLQRKYLPLMQANFLESNPMPVKCVLAMMGRIEENYRLPMPPVKKETRSKLEKIAAEVGLLKKVAAS